MRNSNKSKRKEKNFHMELPPIYIDKSGRKGVCKIDGKLPKGK